MTAEAAEPLARVLARFPPREVRAALATAAIERGGIQVDKVLRILADRLWADLDLPPPTDVAIAEIWRHIDAGRNGAWSNAVVALVVERFGWAELYGQEIETAGVRRAQIRRMYEAERERILATWIADVTLAAEAGS